MIRPSFLRESSAIIDLLLASVTMIYVAGSTRLMSLVRHTIPQDARRSRKPPGSRVRGRWLLPKAATSRSGVGIPSGEVVVLLLGSPGRETSARRQRHFLYP